MSDPSGDSEGRSLTEVTHVPFSYEVVGFVLWAKVTHITGGCESSVSKALRGVRLIGYEGCPVLSAEEL